jgi:hypothetical protein
MSTAQMCGIQWSQRGSVVLIVLTSKTTKRPAGGRTRWTSSIARTWSGIMLSANVQMALAKEVAWARQVAMYLIRAETEASLPAIGEALGGRDHTTVMYGCEKVADMVERDDNARRQLIAIR